MIFFITATLYRSIIIAFGVLYPAFNSYKSLNRRDGYEQVKWMMYWIVFSAFTACEMITDVFLSWFPLYNEMKIAFVLWMVLPMTRGSSYLYRRVIHPHLLKHESDIDRYIASASNKGCEVLLEFGQHGMNFAANAVIKTADHLKRSYSVGDVSAQKIPSREALPQIERTQSQSSMDLNYQGIEQEPLNSIQIQEKTGRGTRSSTKTSKQNINARPVHHRSKKGLLKLDEEC